MLKRIDGRYLRQCVDIAYKRNNIPESNCAYCSKNEKAIFDDFNFIINDRNCLMVGCFGDEILIGILGCFYNSEKNWVDCIGPFFKDEWNQDHAEKMFQFAQATLSNAERFNFYFNVENKDCNQLMGVLSAERQDNEYVLLLEKAEYITQQIKVKVIKYVDKYEKDVMCLHDETFPDIYVDGKELIASVGKTREVFCSLDNEKLFVGYGVLKSAGISNISTAEIFAVKKEKRGNGYGWALLNCVVDYAFRNHKCNAISLVVDKLNSHARNLYYSCGFKLVVENEAFCIKKSPFR